MLPFSLIKGALTIGNRATGLGKDSTENFEVLHLSIEKNAHKDTLMINKQHAGKDVLTLYLIKKDTRCRCFSFSSKSMARYILDFALEKL